MLLKLIIDKKSIVKNLDKIKKINKNVIFVLKDDAYGLGIKNILPILVEEKEFNYAVAYEEEAFLIKKIFDRRYINELNKLNILILNYVKLKNIKKIIKNNIGLTIFNIVQFENYVNKMCEINKKERLNKVKLHFKFNIGMNRLGFDVSEIENIKILLKKLVENTIKYEIESIYAHVSNSENENIVKKQINDFEKIVLKLENEKIGYKYKHVQASPLLFSFKEKYNFDFARIGMAMYGLEPLNNLIPLEQSIKLVSKVINVRSLEKGEFVSYGEKNKINENKRIAVIGIGYAHGLQKQMENSDFYVLINGKQAKLVGDICMDMIIVDVTNIDNVNVGDEVVIIGKCGNEEISLLKMAEWTTTIQDDVLVKLNGGIKREVI